MWVAVFMGLWVLVVVGCGLFRLYHCSDSWVDFFYWFFFPCWLLVFIVELKPAVMVVDVWWSRDGGCDGGGN